MIWADLGRRRSPFPLLVSHCEWRQQGPTRSAYRLCSKKKSTSPCFHLDVAFRANYNTCTIGLLYSRDLWVFCGPPRTTWRGRSGPPKIDWMRSDSNSTRPSCSCHSVMREGPPPIALPTRRWMHLKSSLSAGCQSTSRERALA